ncbi:hypothetical protein [uncultured Tateyamaria sp.]|uniref:hypothetical protein n=1 Tax=uncultured Tateyamaria sp. TaxID=455651 RepID=UPI00263812D3|nr:hypothetical protein [uncultured Tateyamaria sp.]
MSAAHLFQDFGEPKPKQAALQHLGAEEIEDQKLEAFEKGYQAGWDDAVAAQTETRSFVSSGLAASLQNASFEYHELRATLNASVEAILRNVTDIILPQIAKASLGAHVRDTVQSMVRDSLDSAIEIVVAPESESSVRAALNDDPPKPFILVTDELLAPTQVTLRVERTEAELHLDRTVADISAAVASFFENHTDEVKDG